MMSEMGMAMMGTAQVNGESRLAMQRKVQLSPLLRMLIWMAQRDFVPAQLELALPLENSLVGQCVEEFASKDATVVVGTVIDESMQEDIKVTIVATGLGEASFFEANSRSKSEMRFRWSLEWIAKVPLLIWTNRPIEEKRPICSGRICRCRGHCSDDLEFLDVPAFLRRQAD